MPKGVYTRPPSAQSLRPTRTCATCGLEKENTEEFFPKRSQKQWRLGLQSSCRECHKKRTKKQHAKRRLEVLRHYSGSLEPFCACCGERELVFLGIDHIDGGGTKHRRAGKSAGCIPLWLKRHGLPKGYQVLCHNCNLAKGFYGTCPHETRSTTTSSSDPTCLEASPPPP